MVARRQLAPYRSTFMTYFRRSGSRNPTRQICVHEEHISPAMQDVRGRQSAPAHRRLICANMIVWALLVTKHAQAVEYNYQR
jgi:hypothetical protein